MTKKTFFLIDSIIALVAILAAFVLKHLPNGYIFSYDFLELLLISTVILGFSFGLNKFSLLYRRTFYETLFGIVVSNLIILFSLSVLIIFGKFFISRLLIFSIVLLLTLLEAILFFFLRRISPPDNIQILSEKRKQKTLAQHLSELKINRYSWLLADILFLVVAFLIMASLKPATRRWVIPVYWDKFLIFSGIWVLLSFWSSKYRLQEMQRFREMMQSILMNDLLIVAIVSAMLFGLKLFIYSRGLFFGTAAITCICELFVAWSFQKAREFVQDNPSYATATWITHSRLLEEPVEEEEATALPRTPRFDPGFARPDSMDDSVLVPLLNRYLDKKEALFLFLNDYLALENIHKAKSYIIDSANYFNVETQEDESIEILFNLHKINDFRWINKYLIRANEILKPNGVFIGCGETLEERRNRQSRNLPRILAGIRFVFDFLLNRVSPKLPFFKAVYFALTKGNDRPLSKCEILGRLYFCGFRVHESTEIDGRLYYIAVKEKAPSTDANPSYGPLFRMKRSGKGGKLIYVYKFRTMHPYAEYLQHYMVEHFGYGEKGKIDDDFRVTVWGKWLRKLWLDELPQLINLAKGELAPVGVRPLSERFLREYPDDLRQERLLYKPGCVPPYVALRMQKVEDYMESERIYLMQKRKHPFWTDVKFFFWAVFNILTNRIRSE